MTNVINDLVLIATRRCGLSFPVCTLTDLPEVRVDYTHVTVDVARQKPCISIRKQNCFRGRSSSYK